MRKPRRQSVTTWSIILNIVIFINASGRASLENILSFGRQKPLQRVQTQVPDNMNINPLSAEVCMSMN